MVDVLGTYLSPLQEGNSWYVLCSLAVFASMLIYGLFYSIGRAFQFESLKRSSKAEILQALATLFMVIFLVGSLNEVESFSISTFLSKDSFVMCMGETMYVSDQELSSGPGPSSYVSTPNIKNTIDIVKCRFEERAQELATMHEQIYDSADDVGNVFALLTMYFSFAGVPVFQGNWVGAWFHEAETYRLLNSFITVVLIGANSLTALINYIKLNMLTVFLPFGLFLRTFKYTRGIGALFMSLAIGLYFIFPILFVMTDPGFVEVPEIPNVEGADPQTNFCLPTFDGTISQAQTAGSAVNSAARVSALTDGQKAVSRFYVLMTTHAFVVFSITLVFIRYMMFILGGEAYDLMRFVAKVV